jgi:hypothetical protein
VKKVTRRREASRAIHVRVDGRLGDAMVKAIVDVARRMIEEFTIDSSCGQQPNVHHRIDQDREKVDRKRDLKV